MSEDRYDQEDPKVDSDDSEDEVEAHKKKASLADELKESDEGSDDFELHRKKAY